MRASGTAASRRSLTSSIISSAWGRDLAGAKATAMSPLLVSVAVIGPSSAPVRRVQRAMPGIPAKIFSIRRATASVASSEVPAGMK